MPKQQPADLDSSEDNNEVEAFLSDALTLSAEQWRKEEELAAEWMDIRKEVAAVHANWQARRPAGLHNNSVEAEEERARVGQRLSKYIAKCILPTLTEEDGTLASFAAWKLEDFIYSLLHEVEIERWRVKDLRKQINLRTIQREMLREKIVSSRKTRTKLATEAADKRHNAPKGSRSKASAIRVLWASGKYSSRDLCAEEECRALGMSFSTARKALRNTPEPVRPA